MPRKTLILQSKRTGGVYAKQYKSAESAKRAREALRPQSRIISMRNADGFKYGKTVRSMNAKKRSW